MRKEITRRADIVAVVTFASEQQDEILGVSELRCTARYQLADTADDIRLSAARCP